MTENGFHKIHSIKEYLGKQYLLVIFLIVPGYTTCSWQKVSFLKNIFLQDFAYKKMVGRLANSLFYKIHNT